MDSESQSQTLENALDDAYLESLEKDSFNEFLACMTDFETRVFNSLWAIGQGNAKPISLNYLYEAFLQIGNIAFVGNCVAAKVTHDLYKKLIFDHFPVLWESFTNNAQNKSELDISLYQDNEQKLRILKNALLLVQFSRFIIYFNNQNRLDDVIKISNFMVECFNKNKIQNQVTNVLKFISDDHFKNKISSFQFTLLENELKDISNLMLQPYF